MSFTVLKPKHFPWFDYTRYSFSMGLQGSTGTYLSGNTASEFDPAVKRIVVKGGMTDQVRTAWAKIGAILEAGGLSYADVTRVVEYVKPEGIERYAEANAVRNEVFKGHQPVVYTVPVKALLRPDAFVEIEVTASPVPGKKETSGVVFLPTVQPVDDQGNVVGKGDVVAQTRFIFERAAKTLAALGVGFDRVVKTCDYITTAALATYKGTGRVRKDHLGPVYPGAAGILMPRLVHPDALIQYDFIATRDTPVAVNPGWTRYQKLTYSPAVRAGKLLFMSGQGSLDPATERVLHDGDVVAQAEYTYGNVLKVLEAAGAGPQNLVKTIEYVTPAALPRYRDVARVREKLLREPWPASTGLICEALLRPEMQIEIDPFAVLD
jgi:enamine deaminase RidA (YjgF/YER057c/UK114 family)